MEVIRNALEICTIDKSIGKVKYMNDLSSGTSKSLPLFFVLKFRSGVYICRLYGHLFRW